MNNEYLLLFASCILCKGHLRSTIIDTQRNNYFFIPNNLYELLNIFKMKPFKHAILEYQDEDRQVINDYVEFLKENDLVYFTNHPGQFPPIDKTFEKAGEILNAVIDIRSQLLFDLKSKIMELENLGCKALQIRIYQNMSQLDFRHLLEALASASFEHIELLLNKDNMYSKMYCQSILKTNANINSIVLYSSVDTRLEYIQEYQKLFTNCIKLESANQCGCVSPSSFNCNIDHVIESFNFNTCLNKKISIDEFGFVKTCPSAKQQYGNASDTTIKQVLEIPNFKEKWNISKDKILVCMDCEFRLICTDCREYTLDESNPFSKPKKCKYDPYKAVWAD